ncbi:MAG: hypothetical protein ACRDTA_20705 [Pseudonocardiaceae bacterium]
MIVRAPTDGQATSEGRGPGAPVLATVLLMRPRSDRARHGRHLRRGRCVNRLAERVVLRPSLEQCAHGLTRDDRAVCPVRGGATLALPLIALAFSVPALLLSPGVVV